MVVKVRAGGGALSSLRAVSAGWLRCDALAAGHAVRAGREALAFASLRRQHGLGPQVGSARRCIVTMLPLATIVPGAGVCEST